MSKKSPIPHLALCNTNLRQTIPIGLEILCSPFANNWRSRTLRWHLSISRWWTATGSTWEVSDSFCQLLGYEREELLGSDMTI